MVNYHYDGDTFVIEDFQKAKTFASFLPAVAGIDGKPLWAFYANVGQAMGGFGVGSKDTPITPFDSANLAYQNIPTRSFRTFLKIDGQLFTPFFRSNAKQIMYCDKASFRIEEISEDYRMEITYSTVPHSSYAGLIRKVTYQNITDSPKTFSVVDGLPIFFPHGLSNFCYKELVSLMAAYCIVTNYDVKAPFVKFKTSTGDNSRVQETKTGNGFVTIDQNNERLTNIYDLRKVFGDDMTLLEADNFKELDYDSFLALNQQSENKLPCAFSTFCRVLGANESYTTYSLFGMFDDVERFNMIADHLMAAQVESMIEEGKRIIDELLAPATVHTSNEMFDRYLKQCLLDNSLRGGFPIKLDNEKDGEIYYVYSRKHGDMERDYNAFQIPSRYYSSGCGNFRDVNQNRRSDLLFYPYVEDYNVHLFFSLIQLDGQNPLNVKPLRFEVKETSKQKILQDFSGLWQKKLSHIIESYEPSKLYTFLRDDAQLSKEKSDELFAHILGQSHQVIEANFAEGYWIDHWTYNVDLLENYASVYPDKMRDLLLRNDYKYFYSPVYVEPRDEKYSLLPNGEIRQYGAINLKSLKAKCDKLHFDMQNTAWLKDAQNNEIQTTLASKIINLIAIKFSTLDNQGLGIEMECEKPGWNDAMNGLPGLFASGMSETVELLRLVKFVMANFSVLLKDKEIIILAEQYDFLMTINSLLDKLLCGGISQFNYWDAVTSAREKFRLLVRDGVSGMTNTLKIANIMEICSRFKKVLEDGIARSRVIGNGIIPSYLVYQVNNYQKTGLTNHLGYETVRALDFKQITLPPFLEASARALKLGKEVVIDDDYIKIKDSDIFDQTLKMYKTCANIDEAPFEIGRVHAFTKGWLERECNFLHMTYKYLLGLLKAGYYERFYEACKNNLVYNMNPLTYGRNPVENSSFIVPTCNPDKSLHGRGFFARLTGANAEFLDMFAGLFIGEHVFEMSEKGLKLHLNPKLSAEFFDEADEVSFLLFSKVKITYHNPLRKHCYEGVTLHYVINDKTYTTVDGSLAEDIRLGKIKEVYVEIK